LLPEDGKPAEHYVFMRRLHSRDKRPYCVISIYLDERIFRKHPKRFRKETVIPILKDMRDPADQQRAADADHRHRDLEVAKLLQVPLNSPVAEVRRVFTTADRTVIYLGEVTYRGDFIRIDMDSATREQNIRLSATCRACGRRLRYAGRCLRRGPRIRPPPAAMSSFRTDAAAGPE
jgi:hypothetical protein